jgi:GH24 family phage-related lysozyme (muramidase)
MGRTERTLVLAREVLRYSRKAMAPARAGALVSPPYEIGTHPMPTKAHPRLQQPDMRRVSVAALQKLVYICSRGSRNIRQSVRDAESAGGTGFHIPVRRSRLPASPHVGG